MIAADEVLDWFESWAARILVPDTADSYQQDQNDSANSQEIPQ